MMSKLQWIKWLYPTNQEGCGMWPQPVFVRSLRPAEVCGTSNRFTSKCYSIPFGTVSVSTSNPHIVPPVSGNAFLLNQVHWHFFLWSTTNMVQLLWSMLVCQGVPSPPHPPGVIGRAMRTRAMVAVSTSSHVWCAFILSKCQHRFLKQGVKSNPAPLSKDQNLKDRFCLFSFCFKKCVWAWGGH